jgi:PEP-CTERM motif
MRRHLTAAGLLGLALSLGAGEASANIVFTLQLVTFFDGGTATGAFTTNDALDSLIDYDITTSGGIFPGFRYNSTTAPVDSSSIPSILVVEDATPVHILQLTFLDGLTTAGAPILLGGNDSFEQVGSDKRFVSSGSVIVGPQSVAVPEPSTLALTTLGGIGVLGYRWRRKRA